MLRCTHCDHFNLPDAKNCERCGAPLAHPVEEAPTEALNSTAPTGLEAEVLQLARTQGKIPAIKRYREATGAGLKEAKEAVEAMMERHGVKGAAGKGCGSAVLMAAVVIGAAAWGVLRGI